MPQLTKHQTTRGPRWALDGRLLADGFQLDRLLALTSAAMPDFLRANAGTDAADGALLAANRSGG